MKTKKTSWKKLPTGIYTRVVNGRVEVKTEKERLYRSNQGRSAYRQETNEKMMFWSLVGLFLCIVYITLIG